MQEESFHGEIYLLFRDSRVGFSEWYRKCVPAPGGCFKYDGYQVLGNLTVSFKVTVKAATYNRSFDLTTGIHTTSFSNDDGNTYTSTDHRSYPYQVCIYQLISTANLLEVLINLENQLVNSAIQNQTCGKGYVRLTGVTQADLLLE